MLQEEKLNELLELCKNGDKNAQESIFYLKKDELFAICRRYASCFSQAEDMFIEGFTKIFTNISSFSDGKFDAWAKTIMINTCINAYNKEKRHKERELPIENYTEQVEIESEKTFTHEDLQNCLDQLNEKQRIIFNLYAIDLYKPNEIAEMLNLSNESVRTDIHRSKQKLKNLLLELKNRREQWI